MKTSHLIMVLGVVAIWGLNFVFIRIGLNGVPPILLCAIRFTLAAFPAVLFVPRPKCAWLILIKYGLIMFALQFSLLFTAIKLGMPAGLASLLMQLQAFFTMALAAWIFHERPSTWKILGALISLSGIGLVALHTSPGDVTILGLVLTLFSACAWGGGNIISKKIGAVSPLSLVVWGSLIAAPALILLCVVVEGPAKMYASVQNLSLASVGAIIYIVYFSTHIAYSMWSHLLHKYPTSTVAPFSLLVPIFGFLGSVLILGEPLPRWKIEAAIVVIAGLCFNVLEARVRRYFR